MKITIATDVNAPLAIVWNAWITPQDITQWNFASDDWCCPRADIDLQAGGKFNYRMEAKDGSMGFDFEGEFTHIIPEKSLHFTLGDDRTVCVDFTATDQGTRVTETFEAEDEYSAEQQKTGWHSILNNFKQHVECKSN